jgi:hypothetical protein
MLQVIEKSTVAVMSDHSWLETTEEVVLRILQMETMNMTESVLFINLVKWGRAQVDNEADVRAKIDNCLKLIHFCTMECAEFSTLCCKPIPLTAEEKCNIFLSITQRNSKYLPDGFSIFKMARCIQDTLYPYHWEDFKITNINLDSQTEPSILTFTVEPICYLTGVSVFSLTEINVGKQLELDCKVYNSENPTLCLTSATFCGFVETCDISGELKFCWPVLMKPGTSYTVKITYRHKTKIPSVVFYNPKSYTWDASNPVNKTTIMFNDKVKRVVDISGLMVGKNIV